MSLTYAGVPLLLPDRAGRLERFLTEYQCLDELRAFATESSWQAADRKDGRSGFTAGINMPTPNWPSPPSPKLNTLYWPSGAARWAWGLFLASKSQVDAILGEIAPSSGGVTLAASSAELVIRDDESNAEIRAVGMHLLPPRPISVPGISADESLWLLPIVDDRYFWQFIDLGAIDTADVLDETSTWAELWTLIQTALGITITKGTISADYFQPDPREFSRDHQNIAMLMDAAAASVGQRIVRQLDGSVESLGNDNATTALSGNVSGSGANGIYRLIAGGDFSDSAPWSIRPEKVKVVFPRYDLGRPDCNGAVHAEEVTATSLGVASYRSNLVKTFFNTAFADFAGDADVAATPTNTADMSTLATKIATDYYAWLAKQFDYTFAGVKPWAMSGFEDWVAWTWGALSPCEGQDDAREATERLLDALVGKSEDRGELSELIQDMVGGGARPKREYLCCTRAYSLPANFGVEDLANQFELPVYDDWLTVKLEGTLSAGGSVTCGIWEHDGSAWVDTTENVTAYDDTTSMTGVSGDWAYLHWHCQSKRWQIAQKECEA